MIKKIKALGPISLDIAWVVVILFLPITSFPLLSRLAGNTMVAPASFLPLGWLILFWFIFYFNQKRPHPSGEPSIPVFYYCRFGCQCFCFFLGHPSFQECEYFSGGNQRHFYAGNWCRFLSGDQ